MNDDSEKVTKPEEEQTLPDPAGPPQPVAAEDDVLRGLSVVGVILVAAGGLLLPMVASTGATSGATRSTKIRWEQREAEVRRAMADDQAPAPVDDKPGGSQQGVGDHGGN